MKTLSLLQSSRNVRNRTSGDVCILQSDQNFHLAHFWSQRMQRFLLTTKTVQTVRMLKLIWVFDGRTCQKVHFLSLRLNLMLPNDAQRTKKALIQFMNNVGLDQHVHLCSLILAYSVRLHIYFFCAGWSGCALSAIWIRALFVRCASNCLTQKQGKLQSTLFNQHIISL